MTTSKIKAIRFFFQESPQEFSETVNIPVTRICLMEAGSDPGVEEVEKLLNAELILNMRGTTPEMIDEREDLYEL